MRRPDQYVSVHTRPAHRAQRRIARGTLDVQDISPGFGGDRLDRCVRQMDAQPHRQGRQIALHLPGTDSIRRCRLFASLAERVPVIVRGTPWTTNHRSPRVAAAFRRRTPLGAGRHMVGPRDQRAGPLPRLRGQSTEAALRERTDHLVASERHRKGAEQPCWQRRRRDQRRQRRRSRRPRPAAAGFASTAKRMMRARPFPLS